MTEAMTDFIEITRGTAPLIVSMPHTGTALPPEIAPKFVSPWLARRDADWWIHRLYDFAADLGATTIRTTLSRSVIDVNRDPSGKSLYPGQTTTGLCPTETFDGDALYKDGTAPDETEIARRRIAYFQPYHDALAAEIARLRQTHPHIVLYEAHSIRSVVPRLFDGELPQFNIGTNNGQTCGDALARAVEQICDASGQSRVTNGRFKGGWTTRAYGQPQNGVHAIQMELSCRGYMDEPDGTPDENNWPSQYVEARAAAMRQTLTKILCACIAFAQEENA